MAVIKSFDLDTGIVAEVRLTRDEYEALASARYIMLVGAEDFPERLTVGKLGNSNRIMVPKRLLKKHGITSLPKKAPTAFLEYGGEKFMIVKLSEAARNVPQFREAIE